MQRTVFLGTDLRGSTRVAYDANGKPAAWFGYDPYGAALESQSVDEASVSGRLTRRYIGQVFEAQSGLYHYGARLCDTELARFVSVDPRYQTPSPYACCANDPVDHVDRDGAGFALIIIYRRSVELFLYRTSYLITFHDGAFVEIRECSGFTSERAWDFLGERFAKRLVTSSPYPYGEGGSPTFSDSPYVTRNVLIKATRILIRMQTHNVEVEAYRTSAMLVYGFGATTIIGRYIEDVAFRRTMPSALALWPDQAYAAFLFDAGGEIDPVTALSLRKTLGALQEYLKPSQLRMLNRLEAEARALMQPLPPLRKPGEPPTGDLPPELLRDPQFKRAKFAWGGRTSKLNRKNRQQLPTYHTTTTTTSVTNPAETSSSDDEPPPLMERYELEAEEMKPQPGGKEKPTPSSSDDETESL